ncbi:MAG TPA: NYN domain-containing protein [Solirubrobacterales bacterium]|nr:NYN domain-containing protein [Solirubrobacterales bacterium]
MSAAPPEPEAPALEGFALIVVDGNNALGSRPDGWWRDRPRAMRRLVAGLRRLAESLDRTRVEVVFDGRPHAQVTEEAAREPAVPVEFAGPGADAADKVIAARVREAERPGAVLVVSSDRRLRAAVKAAGGASAGAGGFVREHLREPSRDDG